MSDILTVTLGRREVLAKWSNNDLSPVTYANRTQARKRVDKLGTGWDVFHPRRGGPFYVARVLDPSSPEGIAADYTERANAARKAGAVCEINTAMETLLIRDSNGEDMFRQGQSAQDLIDEANTTIHECGMDGLISLEDYLLATCA